MNRTDRRMQTASTEFKTRNDNGNLKIEGYFAVFDSIYEIAPGMSESIAQGAFDNTLSGDIRALINHDTTLVLGRTKANTLELRTDSHGLWGSIDINPNDSDAMNLYSRVERGDVNQCSFGFDILNEETDFREDGSVHWTIKKVKLYECSIVAFPAYQQTSLEAREKDYANIKKRQVEAWQTELRNKLQKGAH